eukprot:1845255-Amphidinium_carterae.1
MKRFCCVLVRQHVLVDGCSWPMLLLLEVVLGKPQDVSCSFWRIASGQGCTPQRGTTMLEFNPKKS